MSELDKKIESSALYKIFTCEDEDKLDSYINWNDKETRMIIKKMGVILSGKKNNKLNLTALKIASDRTIIKELLNGNIDIYRLRILLEFEFMRTSGNKLDIKDLIDIDYASHDEIIEYINSINFEPIIAVPIQSEPVTVEAIPIDIHTNTTIPTNSFRSLNETSSSRLTHAFNNASGQPQNNRRNIFDLL